MTVISDAFSFKKDKNLLYISIFIVLNLAHIVGFAKGISIYGGVWHADPVYHNKVVEAWLAGENPLTNREYFVTLFPYPPAFHLTVAVLSKILFTSPATIFNLLQLFLFSLILSSTLYLVSKIKNFYVGILTVCLLVSGIAFWDRSSQPIPNGFDALLFPLVIYVYIKGKRKILIALSTFLIYNHIFYAVVLLSSLVAYSLRYNQERIKDFAIVGLLSLPLFLLYIPHILQSFESPIRGETAIRQYQWAINHPLYNIAFLGYFFSAISFFSILHFFTKKLSDFERILVFWLVALIPMYIFIPHRALSYLAHPLAIMGAITLDDYARTKKQKNIVLLVLFITSWVYIITEYNIMGITTSPIAREIAFLVGDFKSHESFISNLF